MNKEYYTVLLLPETLKNYLPNLTTDPWGYRYHKSRESFDRLAMFYNY